ncbi:MAG: carboxypeptidase regulatory-like domain-containing protein [Pirellulales bacterium]
MRKLKLEALEARSLLAAAVTIPFVGPLADPTAATEPLAVAVAPQAAIARDPALWPFASGDPFNTPLGSGAQYVAETSPVFDPSGGANLNVRNWSHPVYIASATDPIVTITAPNSDILQPALNVQVRVPADATPDAQTDGSLHIIDPTHQTVVELWRAVRQSNGNITATAGIVNDLTGPATFNKGTSLNWHGIRAGGMSGIAGLIRREELQSLNIPHALAIAVRPTALNYFAPGGGHWVYPASWSDNPGPTNRSYGTSGNLYMGSLLAIPPDVNINSLGLSPQGLAVARALQDYGAYITDTGGGNVIYYAERGAADIVTTSGNELGRLTPYLRVVANNGPNSIGGGGVRRRDPAPAFEPDEGSQVSVSGIVLPLSASRRTTTTPGATVLLYDAGGTLVATTFTDLSGRYSFQGLIAAPYTLRVRIPGFQVLEVSAQLDSEQTLVLLRTGIT